MNQLIRENFERYGPVKLLWIRCWITALCTVQYSTLNLQILYTVCTRTRFNAFVQLQPTQETSVAWWVQQAQFLFAERQPPLSQRLTCLRWHRVCSTRANASGRARERRRTSRSSEASAARVRCGVRTRSRSRTRRWTQRTGGATRARNSRAVAMCSPSASSATRSPTCCNKIFAPLGFELAYIYCKSGALYTEPPSACLLTSSCAHERHYLDIQNISQNF